MATLKVTRGMSVDVNLNLTANSDGSVSVTAGNGAAIVTFRKDGFLVRHKNTPAVGLRRLPDGRVAMPKRSSR